VLRRSTSRAQNFSGTSAITATLTASAAGYSDGVATVSLYPTGLTYFSSTLQTTTSSSPTPVTVYLIILNPGDTDLLHLRGTRLARRRQERCRYQLLAPIPASEPSLAARHRLASEPITRKLSALSLWQSEQPTWTWRPPTGYFMPSDQPVQIIATVQ